MSESITKRAEVVERLLKYAGDNGYSHIDYADTMRHAAALLQSTPDARPVGDLTEPQWEEIAESCVHLNFEECYLDSVKSMGELILAAARSQSVTDND